MNVALELAESHLQLAREKLHNVLASGRHLAMAQGELGRARWAAGEWPRVAALRTELLAIGIESWFPAAIEARESLTPEERSDWGRGLLLALDVVASHVENGYAGGWLSVDTARRWSGVLDGFAEAARK